MLLTALLRRMTGYSDNAVESDTYRIDRVVYTVLTVGLTRNLGLRQVERFFTNPDSLADRPLQSSSFPAPARPPLSFLSLRTCFSF